MSSPIPSDPSPQTTHARDVAPSVAQGAAPRSAQGAASPADDRMTPAQTRQLLVYLAAAHMAAGAGAHEAEEDVVRAARAIGLPGVQMQANPNGVTLGLGHGEPATFESVEGSLRLDQTARVAAIQHGLEMGSLTPADALATLRGLRRQRARFPVVGMYLGGLVVAAGIAGILQPTWPSVLFAALASPVTVALIRLTGRRLVPAALLPLFAGFIVAAAAFAAFDAGLVASPLRTMLPPVAVLLPGALIVTGLSELVAGAMVSGAARLAHGTTQLVMFAAGVAGASLLTHAPSSAFVNTRVDELGPLAGFIGLGAVTIGICLMESVPRRLAPWVLAVTTLTYATQWSIQNWLAYPAWAGACAGAFVAAFSAWVMALARPTLPRMVLFLPSFWLLVPGSLGLVSVTQLAIDPHESWKTATNASGAIVGIALGLVFGTSAARGLRVTIRRARRGRASRPA